MPAHPLLWTLVGVHGLAAAYVHLRGKARFGLARQLTDHSTLLAPLNALLYLSSKVPAKAYLDPATSRTSPRSPSTGRRSATSASPSPRPAT